MLMQKASLIREVYEFNKEFFTTNEAGEQHLHEIKVLLHVNFQSKNFHIDIGNAFDENVNLIYIPSINCFGNFSVNAEQVIQFYVWMLEINVFAQNIFESYEETNMFDIDVSSDTAEEKTHTKKKSKNK